MRSASERRFPNLVEVSFVPHDDVLFGFRLRLFSLAAEIGVRPACRAMGVHHSTYYRWKHRVERWGLEALRSQGPPPSTDAKRARSAP